MGAIGEFAARLEAGAAKLKESGAIEVCEAQALTFLRIEHAVTPKRSGHLADSEYIDSISGGGSHAIATMGPHAKYAEIENDGGTISAEDRWVTGINKNGKPYRVRHTLHWPGGGFPLHVKHKGSGYVQKAEGLAQAAMRQTAEQVIEAILDLG
jgi:hypothetical protein